MHKIAKIVNITTVIFIVFALAGICDARQKDVFTVKDFRDKSIEIPTQVNRVVTISDGMIEAIMTRLGQAKKIVGMGSACIPKIWSYSFPTLGSKTHEYARGMNPVTHLNPWLMDIPLVSKFGAGINYEKIAALNPDLIIIRTGSCSLSAGDDILEKNIFLLESLGIPLVVLKGPNTFEQPNILSIGREIKLLGQIFQETKEAEQLSSYLESCVELVRERTADINPSDQKRLLLMGLSPKARSQGGAAHVKGVETVQSYFLKNFIHAKNAYPGRGAWNILNTEQLITLDPDVIILVTAWGYHPPSELYEAPYYQNLKDMRAVADRSVAALPWTPCNCEKRLEYPIDVMVMAKAAYPERFKDIHMGQWLLKFYQNVYKVDVKTAGELRSCQWMDWTCEE
ncbi:iron complex transport system substrate-binding protein [Desulfocicer vacuolatum DSM 3385]|uniref:Iron complex transport system substrate-binding protein n=1 Tax=Desulfocicer vacuolatum DSM 3385 TaxID=1121400 RepID=A0A1W2DRB8_9BACT|nr:ABC transporter substrate-binding protein [Desulfocicer vacuolatum]SMC99536.1 iron complex transport system substrate-binding protein [Desulfocicer vacuolatum DSM 3385]